MSDETDPEAGQETTEDEGDQPDIEDDEMAEWGEVAEEIEADTDPEADDSEADEQGDDGDEGEETPDVGLDAGSADGVSVGDIYCNGLGMVAAVGRTRYGTATKDRSDLMDEYGDLARDLQINEYVDQWLAEHGGMDDLGPGQAIVVSTLLFGGMVAMEDPAMVENVAGEVPS